MSDDLIKREDAMQVAFLYPFFSDALMEEINAIPSADRPSGEWIEFDTKWGRSLYYCTNCMETSEVPTVFGNPLYDFCPNCGADMRGKDDE